MKLISIGCLLFSFSKIMGQCPYPAKLVSKNGRCIGDYITVQTPHALNKIVWFKDGLELSTVTGKQQLGDTFKAAGDTTYGLDSNQFSLPYGIFVDDYANIFVADWYNHRIQKWAPGAKTGITEAGGNGEGSAPNQLSYPQWVFVDHSGNVFVSDVGNNRVQKWAPDANSGTTVWHARARRQLCLFC